MIFLILIVLAVVLLFVLFAKRPVNMSGLQANWTPPIDPPAPKSAQPNDPVPPVAPPADVDTVNFNDIFAAKKTPTDRTNV
jgi:hypothetical protein